VSDNLNALQWDGSDGYYEVYYLSATDQITGLGLWIRYTMRAPVEGNGQAAEAMLWFMAMQADGEVLAAYKQVLPIADLNYTPRPFSLRIGESLLTDFGMQGSVEGAEWDLSWQPSLEGYEHVHPIAQKLKVAKTVMELPHADLTVSGTVSFDGKSYELKEARGGQAHLHGTKHAARWAWLHCNDLIAASTSEREVGSFIDAVSVFVPRLGAERGPATPVVGRFKGSDFVVNHPVSVFRTDSTFDQGGWRFSSSDGRRKIEASVTTDGQQLVGVTYTDPDGDKAYCYNSETVSLKIELFERAKRRSPWLLTETYSADRTAHYEYAQRVPLSNQVLHLK